jgi:hypothetical protein
MHIETAYPQCLVPRRAQHLVRRQTIQSVVHPAADHSADYSADETAYRGGHGD